MLKKKNNKPRSFGYIGFHTNQECLNAVQNANNMFIGTRCIKVEFAFKRRIKQLFKPGKYSNLSNYNKLNIEKKSKIQKEINEESFLKNMKQKISQNSQLEEFLNLYKKIPIWKNDLNNFETEKKYQEIALDNKIWLQTKQTSQYDFSNFSEQKIRVPISKKISYTKMEKHYCNSRLFLRNLSFHCTNKNLFNLFKSFGNIKEIHLPLDDSYRFKGFAFIEFIESESARKAKEKIDATIFQGRLIHILPGKISQKKIKFSEITDDLKENMNFNKKKIIKKKEGGKNDKTWNSLFIRSDTSFNSISQQFNVNKNDILNVKKEKFIAIKIAIGETMIIEQTKQILKKQGVNISVFSRNKNRCLRSKTVLIVKNIPYNSTKEEILSQFTSFGNINRCIIPNTKVLAIIEFNKSKEAKQAFDSSCYKKFKNVPLFLEWAPLEIFSDLKNRFNKPINDSIKRNNVLHLGEGEERTIYIKNLNFLTTKKTLRDLFEKIGILRSCTIVKKKIKNKKVTFNSGYGFIEFSKHIYAKKAIQKFQGLKLDGYPIVLSFRKKKKIESLNLTENSIKDRTKILIKNIAFEVEKKELKELFEHYGSIKTIRLPKKYLGCHRGFAFIDFLTSDEAYNAFNALENTHFYGRKLVIQWAK